MKDGTETPQKQPLPTPLEPKDPPVTKQQHLCRDCRQVLTESEAKAHKKGLGGTHDIVPYP